MNDKSAHIFKRPLENKCGIDTITFTMQKRLKCISNYLVIVKIRQLELVIRMNMYYYTSLLAASIVSFVISTTICPFGKKLFSNDPRSTSNISELRQMHDRYIPRIGGLGIVIGFWLTISLILFLNTGLANYYFLNDSRLHTIYWMAGLSITAFLLGFIDDLFDIRARYKLLAQLIIAAVSAYTILPLSTIFIPFLGSVSIGSFGILISIIWIVGVMNAINLIDGLDSLAGGIALIAMVGIAIQSWISNDLVFFTLALTLIFAIAGFLIYNFYPAKVFMGDGGANFLGYLLAVIPLLQIKTNQDSWSIAPIFLLGVPLVDTGFSILRRFIRGIPIFSADRNHLHHKLIAKGLSHRQAVRRLHFVSLVYMLIFLACMQDLIPLKLGLISFIGISWLLVFFAGYEELIKPIDVIKNRGNIREDRSFTFSFSQNIDVFFKQAKNRADLFFIFAIWANQFEVLGYKVCYNKECIEDVDKASEFKPEEIKTLTFEKDAFYLELRQEKAFLDLDSDIKLKAIHTVVDSLFKHLADFGDNQTALKTNVLDIPIKKQKSI